MFDRTFAAPVYTDWYGFEPIVQAIAREASSFDGSVLLVNGDSHLRNDDNPLAAGSRWLPIYHLATPVTNLRRWAIEGSTDDHEWTKLTVAKGKVTELKTVPFET